MHTETKPGEIRAYRVFNRFLQWTLGRYLVWCYRIRNETPEFFKGLRGPYLLLPNHTSFWDPFFVSIFVPEPVYYVTSDAQFRQPIMRFLLRLVGAIPKTKMMSDFETIRHIIAIKRRKGIIGLFPEGRRSWDGHTLPLLYATSKLVKLLRIPVAIPILKGAYLSLPRWSRVSRRGAISLSFSLGFTAEEVRRSSVQEIHEKLTRLLAYDEYEYQKTRMIPFKARRRAEYLELVLFICPHCHAISHLHSRGNRFFCRRCRYSVRYNRCGFFTGEKGPVHFRTIREWNQWQFAHLKEMISEARARGPRQMIFMDRQVRVCTGWRRLRLKRFHFGALKLFSDRIVLRTLSQIRLSYPLRELQGINVQNNEELEFYYRGILYSIRFLNPRVSAFKWLNALNVLKELEAPQGWNLEYEATV